MAKHLNNHHSESSTSRADKMSGSFSTDKNFIGKSKRFFKKFYGKKRRALLKNYNLDKI